MKYTFRIGNNNREEKGVFEITTDDKDKFIKGIEDMKKLHYKYCVIPLMKKQLRR